MDSILILAAEEGAGNTFLLPHVIEEALWAAAASIIVFGLLWWKGGPAIAKALKARTDRIEGELGEAAAARSAAEGELAAVQARIANADAERQRILTEARETAAALKEQLAERTAEDAAAIRARAVADAESSRSRVEADLRDEVATLAIGAAEAVVARNLDATTQASMVDAYIDQVGAGR